MSLALPLLNKSVQAYDIWVRLAGLGPCNVLRLSRGVVLSLLIPMKTLFCTFRTSIIPHICCKRSTGRLIALLDILTEPIRAHAYMD